MKKIKISFGTILLTFAALANLARWIGMFTIADNAPEWVTSILPILGAFSGLVSGLSVAGGLAFIAHRLGSMQAFTPKGKPIVRFWGSLVLLILIVIMSAFLLPPYVRMMTPERLRVETGDFSIWSIMSVLVGDLIIVSVALSDGKSGAFTKPSEQTTHKPKSAARANAHPKGATKSVALSKSASVYPRTCLHCDAVISAPQAVGAHMKKHHPELCKVSPSDAFEALANKKIIKDK